MGATCYTLLKSSLHGRAKRAAQNSTIGEDRVAHDVTRSTETNDNLTNAFLLGSVAEFGNILEALKRGPNHL